MLFVLKTASPLRCSDALTKRNLGNRVKCYDCRMIDNAHDNVIFQIMQKEFATVPGRIERMTNGICNEVYLVESGGREVIVRLHTEPRYLLGSHNHIPLFKSKGIPVPDILAEDYSKSVIPFAYQVQSKIDGRDIKDVIGTLSDDELRAVGAEIANVFRQLSGAANNGKFGVLWGDDKDLVDSWSAEVARVTKIVIGWGTKTGVLDAELEEILRFINSEYTGYFDSVRPYTYFGDIAGKNVLINEGRFSGLVDLDSLAQGDPLEAIGRIKASWYGTHYGGVYANAIMDELNLAPAQRKIVTMYAVLNRTFWTLENGVRFNKNTSGRIDREKMNEDKAAVRAMFAELRDVKRPPAVKTAKPQQIIPDVETEPPTKAAKDVTAIPIAVPVIELLPLVPTDISDEITLSDVNVPTPATFKRPLAQKKLLEASGLSKTYISDGIGFDALKNVDLRVMRGDCIAIVGKSGSGKSTLMHLLACLDAPTDGYVYVDGDETTTMTESEKNRLRNEKFGFVFQQFFLNGRDTVFENVVLPLRIRGTSEYDIETDAHEALEAVGLTDKIDKKAKDLSGGEKQRVCIARALVSKPQVIFADEPTGNLDSNTGAAVENLLFDLNREKGITLVIVTHDPDLANRCGRIVEMKDGRIIADRETEASQI